MARLRAPPAPEPAPRRGSGAHPRAGRTRPPPSPHEALLHGEDSRLVRPYLLAHERRVQAGQHRARRRTLWLAVHGIDVGPRHIHGVDVGSHRIRGNEVAAA
ncbi:hypothetical protein SHKM778_80980 [Streptomyces sp. KM77-8]|uniref:Uncharacterized protein n=1 Tax=Streptomyces haneummycinicus TaxID=3074435 RepID=A0AAT9HVU8_9ACTN